MRRIERRGPTGARRAFDPLGESDLVRRGAARLAARAATPAARELARALEDAARSAPWEVALTCLAFFAEEAGARPPDAIATAGGLAARWEALRARLAGRARPGARSSRGSPRHLVLGAREGGGRGPRGAAARDAGPRRRRADRARARARWRRSRPRCWRRSVRTSPAPRAAPRPGPAPPPHPRARRAPRPRLRRVRRGPAELLALRRGRTASRRSRRTRSGSGSSPRSPPQLAGTAARLPDAAAEARRSPPAGCAAASPSSTSRRTRWSSPPDAVARRVRRRGRSPAPRASRGRGAAPARPSRRGAGTTAEELLELLRARIERRFRP